MEGPARATCSEHVNEELLELYAMGRLGEPKLGDVEQHLLLCGYCQDRLDEIDRFVKVFRQASRQMSASAGDPADDRRDKKGRLWTWVKPVSAAAAVAAAVLTITFFPPRRPGASSQSVDLRAMRGDASASAAEADSGRRLDLRMDIAGVESGSGHKVEIVEGSGKVVWTGSAARQPTGLAVSAPAVRPGQYWVRLLGADGEPVREYGLKVR